MVLRSYPQLGTYHLLHYTHYKSCSVSHSYYQCLNEDVQSRNIISSYNKPLFVDQFQFILTSYQFLHSYDWHTTVNEFPECCATFLTCWRASHLAAALTRSMNFLPVKAAPALVPPTVGRQLSRTPRRENTCSTIALSVSFSRNKALSAVSAIFALC